MNKAKKSVKDKQVDKTKKPNMKCKDMLSVPKGSSEWRGIQIKGNTFWAPKSGSRLKTASNIRPFR